MLKKLGDFTIKRKIAEGGMGTVYLATQESLQRDVAVKVLKDKFADDQAFVNRFIREARSAAALVHPNIIQIHYVGNDSDINYFAMEYVDGENLRDHIRHKIRLSIAESLDIIIKVTDALALAADRDMIHRDIKPENIMITSEGRVKVTDFGLAKCMLSDSSAITEAGKVLGSVNYMAPEQGLGKEIDTRADIYSLGTVFFELLAGRPPFKGDHPTSVIYMHVYEAPPPVTFFNKGVPPEIEAIIIKMMAKEPDNRPQNANELLGMLEEIRESCGLRPSKGRSSQTIKSMNTTAQQHLIPGAPRVLIIDDDQTINELYKNVIHSMGCNVIIARDGIQGLDLWRKTKPDLVILDITMPNLSGLAVLEERDSEQLSGSVIVATASADWKTIKRVSSKKVSGYLLKPFELKVFRQRIIELLPGIMDTERE
ncbi:MAG: protein kinase [Planctomycetes bacterium]|nr:protein kinase [Planctomycetota bacterium]